MMLPHEDTFWYTLAALRGLVPVWSLLSEYTEG